ncbi:MAG: DUF6515 family protein [Ginsengibacter sp.]
MKHINILLLTSFFSALLFTNADAQRRENGGSQGRSGENRQSNSSPSRNESANTRSFSNVQRTERVPYNNRSASGIDRNSGNRDNRNTRLITSNDNNQRSYQQNSNNSANGTSRVLRERNTNVNQTPGRNSQTSRVTPQSNSRTFDQQRNNNRNVVASNNSYRNNNYRNNNYRNNNYSNRNNYRNSYYSYNNNGGGRRFYVAYGPRYSYRPHNSISLYFGGFPYYYTEGLYYSYYSGYYQPVFPPFGIRISTLPFGYSRLYVGADPFYYYGGTYYRQYDDNNYEVVDAPMGATVSSLPNGAKSVLINDEKFYELNGTYYKEDRDSKGRTVYIVVGKNGEINNSVEAESGDYSASPLNNGDIVPELPEGSKIVTLNGEKLYLTPDDTYLREEANGDTVQYRVVGK